MNREKKNEKESHSLLIETGFFVLTDLLVSIKRSEESILHITPMIVPFIYVHHIFSPIRKYMIDGTF